MSPRPSRWKASLGVFSLGFVLTVSAIILSQTVDHGFSSLKLGPGRLNPLLPAQLPQHIYIAFVACISGLLGGLMFLLPYWFCMEKRNSRQHKWQP